MSKLWEPELIFYANSTLLEGPVWNKIEKKIMFVSIEQGCVYEYEISTGIIHTYFLGEQVGCAVYEQEGSILAAAYQGIYRINRETGEKTFVVQLNTDQSLRYNDGTLDAAGRFLVGTTGYNRLAEGENCLYSFDGKKRNILIEGTSISNGIDFSKDNKYMYFVDTPTKRVARYYYDFENGNAVFDKNIIKIEDDSLPDGICTDIDDMLWVAHWGGYKVSKWNPFTGEKIMEIKFPCKNVSSCCVGGEEDQWLFVTTAKDEKEKELFAGGLFRVKIR